MKSPKSVKFSETATRGRRECMGCHKFVGVRAKVCPLCGHEMTTGVAVAKIAVSKFPKTSALAKEVEVQKRAAERAVEKPVLEASANGGVERLSAITTPAGLPVIELSGTDEDTVSEWIHKVQADARSKGMYLTPDAMKYYARYAYNINTPEWKIAAEMIERIMPPYVPKAPIVQEQKPKNKKIADTDWMRQEYNND